MIARLEVTRGALTEYPLAEKVPGGWQNGVTFYPDADVTKITPLFVSAPADQDDYEAGYAEGFHHGWSTPAEHPEPPSDGEREALKRERNKAEFNAIVWRVRAETAEAKLARVAEPIENAIGQAEEWEWVAERGDILAELNRARAILNDDKEADHG